MPSSKRQPSKPAHSRSSRSAAKSAPRGGSRGAASRGASRARKPSGGVLARAPSVGWSWSRLSIDRKLDIVGVILALVGLLTLLSLFSPENGAVTGWWVRFVRSIAGWGSFVLPLALVIAGVWLVLRNVERLPMFSFERVTGFILLYLNVLAWMHMSLIWMGEPSGIAAAQNGQGGGWIGAVIEILTVGALGPAGAVVVYAAWLIIAVALTLDVSVSEIFHHIQQGLASLARRINQRVAAEQSAHLPHPHAQPEDPDYYIPELDSSGRPKILPTSVTTAASAAGPTLTAAAPASAKTAGAANPSGAPSSELPPDFKPLNTRGRGANAPGSAPGAAPGSVASRRAAARAAGVHTNAPSTPLPPWKLPDIADILDPGLLEPAKTPQDNERSKVIEETLASFGAPVRVVATFHGPTVTQFGVEPLYIETRSGQTRVRVSKIAALADDLALALAAPRIRIQAPVPGRNYVGIEVPNQEISRVVLRDVMESDAFHKLKSPLRFALGKDVAGHPKSYDLTAMPHLLIAGTTGSGKSVLVNALLTCFLLNNTPTDLRMILVDPKRVELTGYNGIPHLLAPVVVEAEQVVGALQWVQREMDARYHRFSQVGARNIADYNARNSPPLPYMLVLVDELADLMMLAPDETERSLTRLAQLARATGIHLILATQRPSVDVVTGLIKANFPARVAFAVASGTDSRVILDQPGAERLLGRGDMLFQAPDAAAPVRLQGVWVSDPESQRLVEYWRQQAYELRNVNLQTPTATPVNMDVPLNTPLRQTPLFGESEDGKPTDPIMADAIKIVREEGKASISMLQRKLRIGYTRSARLIEQLEEAGIIGPAQPTSQVREVLDFGEEHASETENNIKEE